MRKSNHELTNHKLREYQIIKDDFINSCFQEKNEDIVSWKVLILYMAGVLTVGIGLGLAIAYIYGQYLTSILGG